MNPWAYVLAASLLVNGVLGRVYLGKRDAATLAAEQRDDARGLASACSDATEWSARRVVWALAHGRLPKRTLRIAATCGNDLCVHPDHAAERSRAFELKGLKRDLAFKARIAATKRQQAGTPPAAVAFVRASSSSHAQAARETGLTQQMVSKIRSHDRWRNYRDPFAAWGC